jgi:hypothetical protein
LGEVMKRVFLQLTDRRARIWLLVVAALLYVILIQTLWGIVPSRATGRIKQALASIDEIRIYKNVTSHDNDRVNYLYSGGEINPNWESESTDKWRFIASLRGHEARSVIDRIYTYEAQSVVRKENVKQMQAGARFEFYRGTQLVTTVYYAPRDRFFRYWDGGPLAGQRMAVRRGTARILNRLIYF